MKIPLDIDLNLCLSYEEEEITNVDLNVNPSYIDLNVYPSYEEEFNVNLNMNHSYEVAEEEYRDDLMNVGISYEEVFHENEAGTHSSTSHIINHADISLNEATVSTDVISRMFLINKILPAIKEKWPREHACETIFIQQDNAPCHVSLDDEEFRVAASEGGFDIRLTCQPPNSPDLNVLDLGFFTAIQSLQQKEVVNSVDELIQVVENAYESVDIKSSNKIFLTLQSCMVEIMKKKGSNNYKIPHMKKDVLHTQGMLPTQLKCDRELVQKTYEYLYNVG
ncbi:hypothetical protein KIW84_061935 [Lathyrus oleraceus]|uniref:Transposase n=1 Tax=Pisum sativum TaxID=3888 RepID=A0A9D5A307_PEA|nr:hypothetical protein KIW84_061935 [Pisum sativum]